MKLTNTHLMIGGAAVIGLVLMSRRKADGKTTTASGGATEISQPSGASWDNGWRYFSDGTSIDPNGTYYMNGMVVYRSKG